MRDSKPINSRSGSKHKNEFYIIKITDKKIRNYTDAKSVILQSLFSNYMHRFVLPKNENYMKNVILLFTLAIFCSIAINIYAQESVNTTGGEAVGDGGSVSYSVGQVTYQTYTGTNGSVSQGVQQPFEISVVTAIEEAQNIKLSVSAYPNPTTDYLILEVKDFELEALHFQLYDINAKLIQSGRITGNQTSIVMRNLVPATYFVRVMQNNKEIKTFKVIKQ
jgi:hypothetical protein